MRKLSYPAETVYTHSRDLFLRGLFVPEAQREKLLALYALDAELAHVHRAVREETIGHIRYAWWEESLQAIMDGKPPREHPVIQALPKEYMNEAMALAQLYRAHYPVQPDSGALIEEISLKWIRENCPEAEAGWKKAHGIITAHRKKFGTRANGWLKIKLMVA